MNERCTYVVGSVPSAPEQKANDDASVLVVLGFDVVVHFEQVVVELGSGVGFVEPDFQLGLGVVELGQLLVLGSKVGWEFDVEYVGMG